MKDEILLMGVGDVGPIHEPMGGYATLARPVLSTGDIRFGQCERVYTERGALQVHSGGAHSRLKPHMVSVFSDCGFNVVSVASNHSMDWGPDAMLDSIDVIRAQGIQTIGAGRDLDEAMQPAVIEYNGVRVAMLAFCSVLQEGYAAGPKRPGVAPLRAHTYYRPVEYQAGIPPRIVTEPHEEDLVAMVGAIAGAKKRADAVVLSIHWGIHYIPRMIADYQPTIAKAAFAAGADLILGHHAHTPKAIGVYGGKVCFYSLSNFIMSSTEKSPAQVAAFKKRYSVEMDPAYPRLPFGVDGKRSLVARAVITRGGVKRVSFLPALIDTQLRPEILRAPDPRFEDGRKFMDWVSEEFDHRFTIDGDEIVITGAR